ncbi:MAG: hypothetical protein E6I84_11785, partial [Chloroflexi bacterium]
PAVLGYLAVGLIVSPFTPGYVADRHQLQLLADVGVVLLLFEVGIEIDPLEIGRERGRLFAAAPAQVVLSTLVAGGLGLVAGLRPPGALLLGLCVALSSSVVVVNITRSRRRTTDAATNQVLLGWSVVQDMVGVTLGIVAVIGLGLQSRSGPVALLLTLLYLAVVVIAAGLLPRLLRGLREEHDLFLIFTIASALALAGIGAVIFGIPLALAAFALPRPVCGDVLCRDRRADRPRRAAQGIRLAGFVAGSADRGKADSRLCAGPLRAPIRPTTPGRTRPRPDR